MEEDSATDSVATKNFTDVTLDEDLGTNEADDEVDEKAHPTPRSCRLMEDHLVLIFEMYKDLVEQQHHQCTLNKHLDILYDSLSREPEKSRCLTCCQPFNF